MANESKDIIEIVRELQATGQLHRFSPYCVGIVTSEESAALDCPLGDEYALFHAIQRSLLCDWHSEKFSVEKLAQAFLVAVGELERITDRIAVGGDEEVTIHAVEGFAQSALDQIHSLPV